MGELPAAADVRLIRRAAAGAAFAAVTAGLVVPAHAGASTPEGVAGAVSYLVARQQANGAFFAASAPADVVAEAAGVVSALGGPRAVVTSAMRYVGRGGRQRATERGGIAARIVLGLVAAGLDPSAHDGTDFVAALRAHYNPVTGLYDTGVYANALAVLGASAAGIPLEPRTYESFRLSACANGGLSHQAGCAQAPDVDTTSMAIIALRAAGRPAGDALVTGARRFLLDARNHEGAWGLEAGAQTNANSTGLALSAVAALGEDPTASPWRQGARDPARVLAAMQLRGGAFPYLRGGRANDYATVQAAPGSAGMAYPLRRAASAAPRTGSGRVSDAPSVASSHVAAPRLIAAVTTHSPSPTIDAKASRRARVRERLGDRESGAGARAAALWISVLIGGALIAAPLLLRRRRRT